MLANPLVPVLDYVINYEYIANELCVNKAKPQMHCNGMCHLKKELAKKVVDEDDGSQKTDVKKVELPVFFLEDFCALPSQPVVTLKERVNGYKAVEKYQFLYEKQCFKPPILG